MFKRRLPSKPTVRKEIERNIYLLNFARTLHAQFPVATSPSCGKS
jgi:hypothetical protein